MQDMWLLRGQRERPWTYRYDDSYPVQRGHFEEKIGRLKTKTLRRWLTKTGTEVLGRTVCEVGFGSGFCLRELRQEAASVYGIEAVQANIDNAAGLGLSEDHLMLAGRLRELPDKVDVWLFQDSFEHIEDSGSFMEWLVRNSSSSAKLLMVLPRADCASRYASGRLWPHRLADHRFHWSKRGLVEFMAARSFHLAVCFSPFKYVSVGMILNHLSIKFGVAMPRYIGRDLPFLFNIGEMGMVFRRKTQPCTG